MKKIIHREVFGCDPKKREVSIDETLDRSGSRIRKIRSCKYYVSDEISSKDPTELEMWIEKEKKAGLKKNCHVLREIDTVSGLNKIVCKVLGEFFTVRGDTAFKIFYVNVIKMELESGYVSKG